MRFASVLVLLLALGLCTGAAFADPINDMGETWEHNWPASPRVAEVEPNGTCATAQPVALGDIVDPAALTPAADLDFYMIYLTTADKLSVLLDKATGCVTGIDTQVYIYRDDCTTQLAWDDDDGPGLYSYVAGSEFTPPYDGNYAIKVKHYSATGTGCYKIWFYSGLNMNGACCSPSTGVCTITGPGLCSSPSIFQGPATVCVPNPCPQPILGACCATTGLCTVTTQTACAAPSVWQGANTVCNPNSCPGSQPPPVNDTCAGALPLARCSGGSIAGDLTWAFGDYSPAGTPTGCTGYSVGAPGRDVVYLLNVQAGDLVHLVYTTPSHDGSMYIVTDCSNVYASCVIGEDEPEPETINWTVLTTGTYSLILDAYSVNTGGLFTLEWLITCPPPNGSCCYVDGTCAVTTQANCTATWLLDGVCVPNTCLQPPTGECCSAQRTCTVTTQALCTGTWTEGGDCDPDPCVVLQLGSCCYLDGTCAVTTQATCTATWTLDGVCVPNTCPPPPPVEGSCCYSDGTCAVTTEANCTATWLSGGVCVPNTCLQPPPEGACCDQATGNCTITTEAACQFHWLGAGVACDPSTCAPPVPTERTSWGQIKNNYR